MDHNGDQRLAALHETRLLDTPPEESFDRLTRLAARLLGVPVSLVSLVDRDRQFFKSQQGLPEPLATQRETPLSHSFCQHVTATGEPLIVPDAGLDARVRDNLARRDLGVVSYLGVPLTTPDGHVLGSLCAVSGEVRAWSEDDLAVMRDLAAIAMTEIALRDGIRQRDAAQAELELLAGELQHRVKNSIATAQAVVQLSIRAATDLDGLGEAVGRRLASLAATQDLLDGTDRHALPLRRLLGRELAAFAPDARVVLDGPEVRLDAQQGVALGMIVHELTTNASKYGALQAEGGRLAVTWSLSAAAEGPSLLLEWRETGVAIATPPTRRGFGSTLMDRLARTSLGGQAVTDYGQDGVVVRITVMLAAT